MGALLFRPSFGGFQAWAPGSYMVDGGYINQGFQIKRPDLGVIVLIVETINLVEGWKIVGS